MAPSADLNSPERTHGVLQECFLAALKAAFCFAKPKNSVSAQETSCPHKQKKRHRTKAGSYKDIKLNPREMPIESG